MVPYAAPSGRGQELLSQFEKEIIQLPKNWAPIPSLQEVLLFTNFQRQKNLSTRQEAKKMREKRNAKK